MLRASLPPLLLLWLVAACSETGPTAPRTPEFTAAITCQASVTAGTVTCGSPRAALPRGLGRGVTLGGQGTYVKLTSSGTAYDGSAIFSTNVTVQNLIVQPMNSADGLTADVGGIKVFFNTGPTVTGGTGTVDVNNADGTGAFTGTNQPFFLYSSGSLLPSGGTTASKLWKFDCPNTVTTFDFTVFVTTKLPADQSVLLWTALTSPTTHNLHSVSVQSFSSGFPPIPTLSGWAVGDGGTVLHYDGSTWSTANTGNKFGSNNLYGVDETGAGTIYVVGEFGTIGYSADTGKTWTTLTSTAGLSTLFAVSHVSGSGGTHVFIVGEQGLIFHSTDGTTFTQLTSGTADSLLVTGGFADTNFFAGGQSGTGLRWNNTSWSAVNTGTSATLHAGSGATDNTGLVTDIWLVGTGGTIIHSTSPVGASGSWSAQISGTTADLFGMTSGGQSDLFAVGGGGTIQHYNGLAWSPMADDSTKTLNAITLDVNILLPSPIEYWAVGNAGIILHGTR